MFNPSKNMIFMSMILLLATACGNEVNEEIAGIKLTPEELFFEAPDDGASSKVLEVSVSNDGAATLVVSSVTVAENDDSPEVTIANSESWSDSVSIPSESSVILRVEWTPSNNIVDRGQVVFDTNIGERTINFTTAPLASTPVNELCGDGELQSNEECDDGNRETEVCPYGEEECEVCAENCTLQPGATSFCGDGELQEDEACDDGNQEVADGCSDTCELEEGFTCDDQGQCQSTCGDGILAANEACDDGNTMTESCDYSLQSCEVCAEDCTLVAGETSYCGDGDQSPEEQCDDGNNTTESCAYGQRECQVCAANCTLVQGEVSFCGDNLIIEADGEACDDGNILTERCAYGEETCEVCNGQCQIVAGETSYCGDSVVSERDNEACDDGNQDNGDGCSSTCQIELGFTCNDEQVCTSSCGDNIVASNEACDDGNTETESCAYGEESCDVCAADCTLIEGETSYCGDAVQSDADEEECDDGNQENGDGCSDTCQVEEGYTCDEDQVCISICGDSVVAGNETCDDGNTETESCPYGEESCTVCDATCQEVPGATSFCGDNAVNGAETCDDGNTETESCVYGEESCIVCDATCQEMPGATSFCGDNAVTGAETCDDGNAETEACAYGEESCTVCNASCLEVAGETSFCGDNITNGSETCDDGNTVTESCVYGEADCKVCDANCTLTDGEISFCGDNAVNGAETCDDGNTETESCLYGEENCTVCDASCQEVSGATSFCGDGILQAEQGEECDAGIANGNTADTCRADCTLPRCGDGVVDTGESCDDGNGSNADACPDGPTGTCTRVSCADLLAQNPSATTGYYYIDPDNDGANLIYAYCDMVTDGGGWTAIINPQDYQKTYLDQFPAQTDTIVNYGIYTSPATGVSWGDVTTQENYSQQPQRIELNLNYNEIKITYSGFYDNPVSGLGFFYVGNQDAYNNAISFEDRNSDASTGHYLTVGGSSILFRAQQDVIDRTDTISLPNSTLLHVSMNPYRTFSYTARYIRALWIR